MAYTKNLTKEQKKEHAQAAKRKKEEMERMVTELAEGWEEDPGQIAELTAFASRMYQFSAKNTMLIYRQKPYATFVQSFRNWKKMGASIVKGEKGARIYMPYETVVLKIGNRLVPLEHATKEEKMRYHAGEIESITDTKFKIGYVFDIAQTTFPKEQYPSLFHMGYPSAKYAQVVQGLTEYAAECLGCPVSMENLQSIALRGDYSPSENRIRLNALMEDTQKLSTLSHELGHAVMHGSYGDGKSAAQKELEADAFGIMLESYCGISPTEPRKRHLAENYRAYREETAGNPGADSIEQVLDQVYGAFREELPDIDRLTQKYLKQGLQPGMEPAGMAQEMQDNPMPNATAQEMQFGTVFYDSVQRIPPGKAQGQAATPNIGKKSQTASSGAAKRAQAATRKLTRSEIYGEIKWNVRITDYAAMHGIRLRRVGRYYTLEAHDSVRIDPVRNCFWRNSGIGNNTRGSVIDFALAFVHDGDMHAALTELQGMISLEVPAAAPGAGRPASRPDQARRLDTQKSLKESMPKRAANMHRAYAYLTQSRYIDPDIVQDFVNRKMLYQDVRGNCVFVAYGEDGEPNFATFRGTLTQRKFLGDVPGSDYGRNFYIDNHAEKLVVTESVIDAMSVMSILKGQGRDPKEYDYLALTGTAKQEPVVRHLQEKPKKEVLLSLDHDLAGVEGMQAIHDRIREHGIETKISCHVPEGKDWNEDLAAACKKFRGMDTVPYLEGKELPVIHECAIQSTEKVEERGFRRREGRHQYRLVELGENGQLVPVQTEKPNVLYFSPHEVKEQVPPMYRLVNYAELEKQQEEILGAQQKAAFTPQGEGTPGSGAETGAGRKALEPAGNRPEGKKMPEQAETVGEGLQIRKFYLENGTVLADCIHRGEEEKCGIWKKDGKYYIATGYKFDGTWEEHGMDKAAMEKLQQETGIPLEKFEKLPDSLLYSEDFANREPTQQAEMGKETLGRVTETKAESKVPEPAETAGDRLQDRSFYLENGRRIRGRGNAGRLLVRKFYLDNGTVLADCVYQGEEQQCGILKEDGNYLISTGYTFGGTQDEFPLGQDTLEKLQQQIGIPLEEFERLPGKLLYSEDFVNREPALQPGAVKNSVQSPDLQNMQGNTGTQQGQPTNHNARHSVQPRRQMELEL